MGKLRCFDVCARAQLLQAYTAEAAQLWPLVAVPRCVPARLFAEGRRRSVSGSLVVFMSVLICSMQGCLSVSAVRACAVGWVRTRGRIVCVLPRAALAQDYTDLVAALKAIYLKHSHAPLLMEVLPACGRSAAAARAWWH